jgi:hypothetical protein
MATVRPLPLPLDAPVSLYALCRLVGPNPDGVAFGLIVTWAVMSVRRSELQAMTCALVGAAQDRTLWGVASGCVAAKAEGAISTPAVNARAPTTAKTGGLTRIVPPTGFVDSLVLY